jgi:myo-inositol-1(or 4)-monophosphatase
MTSDATPTFRPETLGAIDAVRGALAVALDALGSATVSVKEGRDLVTTGDVASEDTIRAALAPLGLPVIGEERGGDAPTNGSPYWLVDPICGTGNYAAGMKLWCVNVALIEDGAVTAGIVGDPSRSQVLVAEPSRGAWALADGAPQQLATSADSHTVVIEEGKSSGAIREHAGRFMAETVRADRWNFRSFGTTLVMPYLAAGRVAAYAVMYVSSPLHAAAGTLLITEAGGVVTDIAGEPWTLASTDLLAAADASLHAELLAIAKSTAPR